MCEQLQPTRSTRYLPLSEGLPATPPRGALLTLGCFDGLHPGHRALILNARRLAEKEGMPLGVWSPAGAKRTGELMPLYDKLQVLKELGVDFYIEEPFGELRDLSPEEFFKGFLLERYGACALACGENFTFGKGGAGTSETLSALCAQAGILLLVQELQKEEGQAISSARVRGALSDGDLAKAEKLLGAPYGFSAVVIHGRKVGRSLGFPTANLPLPKDCPLKSGVYMVEVHLEGQAFPALANVGVHPTFERASEPLCEAFLLKDPVCSLYDKRVHITFLQFLRPERRFESPEGLKAQIEKDLQYARGFFEKECEGH